MSVISAGTTQGTALVTTGDTTGELILKTNGNVTAVTIGTDQSVTIAGDLTVDGTLIGGGDVTGPASSTDNAVARFDGTTGKLLKDGVVYTDANTVSTIVQRDASGNFSAGTITATLAGSAATLTTARDIQTNLASTSAASFNGSANITPGVTGALGVGNGGTGQTTYTNGQLLIGNTTGNTLTKATLTAGTGISITNGTGSITIASSSSGAGTVVAWVTFNSTSGAAVISASGNVSSVTYNATGKYTANFSSALADANYSTAGNAAKYDSNDDGSIRLQLNGTSNANFNTTTTSRINNAPNNFQNSRCITFIAVR